jgi:polygalacturonase
VYIAPGAIVYGGLRNAPGASNIRVSGGGILDGSRLHKRMVEFSDTHDVEISGITMRNGRSWQNTLRSCSDIAYRGVKIVSFGRNGDGIDPCDCRNVTIDSCFLRCTDDCIAIKSFDRSAVVENISVLNSVMYGYAHSDGVTIGYELAAEAVRNILVKRCDILAGRGGNSLNTSHSAMSVICDGKAHVSNVRYEDLHVEDEVDCLLDLTITDGQRHSKTEPGHISRVSVKNVAWADPTREIRLCGRDAEHAVEDVAFDNCTLGGKPLRSEQGVRLVRNEHVKNVVFRHSGG